MNRPNRPEQPSLVTTVYLDEKLGELETRLLTTLARELDARFERLSQEFGERFDGRTRDFEERFDQRTREFDDRFDQRTREFEDRFERLTQRIELRLTRFEKRLAWQILGTLAGTIVAMTAIFSAVVLIVGIDSGGN